MEYYKKHSVEIVKSNNNQKTTSEARLVDEHNLKLFIEGKLRKKFICVNEHLEEIVVGWLVGNGLIETYADISSLEFGNNNHEVYVEIDKKSIVGVSSKKLKFKDEWIFDLVNEFHQGAQIHKQTSGTHSAILSVDGKILVKREDIGRHNAIDKIVGYLYINNLKTDKSIIFTSGRVSSDLVSKVINAKVPVLVSKSVTSLQAATLAKNKLTLICKAWPDSYEIYS